MACRRVNRSDMSSHDIVAVFRRRPFDPLLIGKFAAISA